jgi:integrase/recombinase XerD
MAPPKGIKSVALLSKRPKAQRGGNSPQPDDLDHSTPDSLATWRDAYLQSLSMHNYASGTVNGRYNSLKYFFAWAADRDLHSASQITSCILGDYQCWLWQYTKPTGERLSWSTQRNRLGDIKEFFCWLTKKKVISDDPACELELPRTESRLPHAVLTMQEMEKLLAMPNVSDPLGVRNRTMLEVFYCTGIRRAELCRLELLDVNAGQRTLHVRLGKGRKDRMVPLGARTLYWLCRYLRETRPQLCSDPNVKSLFVTCYGSAFSPGVISHMVATWLREAGLKRKGCCHIFRHACAVHMLENGADIRFIKKLLGHIKLDTTAIYTEVSIRLLQEVHARCHPSARLDEGCVLPEDLQNVLSPLLATA